MFIETINAILIIGYSSNTSVCGNINSYICLYFLFRWKYIFSPKLNIYKLASLFNIEFNTKAKNISETRVLGCYKSFILGNS